jgi:hypothetical protein
MLLHLDMCYLQTYLSHYIIYLNFLYKWRDIIY